MRVDEVVKGNVNRRRITLKQLGGRARGQTLRIAGQATFDLGERVVLFLEVRPRDDTLYTSAHWQGKWRIERDASTGDERAMRVIPDGAARRRSAPAEVRPLRRFLRDLRRLAAELEAPAPASRIRLIPPELQKSSVDSVDVSDPFTLFFVRWHEVDSGGVIAVDVEAAGQPGLPGGGFGEIDQARGRWNGAGSALVLGAGGGVAANCFGDPRGDGRIRVSFMDPCGEMSNTGGTLAIGGGWSASTVVVVNGISFTNFTTGTIVNNDSAVALSLLTNSNCFSAIQLHELGHAVGLGHSEDPSAIMFPSISGRCSSQFPGLGGDDVAGLLFVYPTVGGGGVEAPNAPTGMGNTVNGSTLFLFWTAPMPLSTGQEAGVATSYVLEAGSGPGLSDLVNSNIGNVTSTTATNVANGTYFVRVRGVSDGIPGAPSNETTVVVGGGGGGNCTAAPGAPTRLAAAINGSRVTVSWSAPGGGNAPTTYIIQAGSAPRLSDLANIDLGSANTTLINNAVGPGTYFVRMLARNSCGTGPASNEIVVTVQ